MNLIDLYVDQKRWIAAIPFLKKYLPQERSDYGRFNQLALAYMESGLGHEAIPILLKPLEIEPNQTDIREVLGTLQPTSHDNAFTT